jgi:hypothetical protein
MSLQIDLLTKLWKDRFMHLCSALRPAAARHPLKARPAHPAASRQTQAAALSLRVALATA